MILWFCIATVLWAQQQQGKAPFFLPPFQFYTLDDKPFTDKDRDPNKALIIFYFDPYCEHCQQQTEWITQKPEVFKNTQLLFVSTETKAAIQQFYEKYLKGKGLDVVMLKDKEYMFDNYFGYTVAPRIFIYDKKGHYVKDFTREVDAEVLRRYLP